MSIIALDHWKKAMKKYKDDPIYKEKLRQSALRYYNEHPEARKKRSDIQKALWENPSYRARMSEIHKKRFEDPINREELKRRTMCYLSSPIVRQEISDRTKKRYEHPEARKKHSQKLKKYFENPLSHKKNSDALKNHHKEHPETRTKLSQSRINFYLSHCWYGCVTYRSPEKYCVLFNNEFKERCRAFDGYKSVISGVPEDQHIVNGKQRKLSVHHVYYQKKACCEWDEDANGYYVMINLGTRRQKNVVRYDIKGDPNKFVTLTHAENTMVEFDKLKWIKFFEELIESRGGKCYFTKEEMTMNSKAGIEMGVLV